MALVLDGSGGISGVDGTASNPAIEGTDSNTGIFYPAADTVAIATGGSQRAVVDASGRVGIGETSPAVTLHLKAAVCNVRLEDADTSAYANVGVDNSGSMYLQADPANSQANTAIYFATDGTERMRLDASGNLGIGISSFTAKLNVQVGAVTTLGAQASSGLLIGGGGSNNNLCQIALGYGTTYAPVAISSITTTQTGNTIADLIFATRSVNTDTAPTERARITSGGALLVGTTAAFYSSSSLFEVYANSTLASAITNANTTATSGCLGLWQGATSGNNLFVNFNTDTAGTLRGSIDYNRAAGQVRYNITSDATLKNIIGDSDGQKSVEILNSTRIREFAWKDDEQQKPQIGVIAQELYETYKGAVSVGGDIEKTDAEGNVTTEYRPWGVDKTAFTFHLIAGWQAHEKMIQELKAEIAALKGAA